MLTEVKSHDIITKPIKKAIGPNGEVKSLVIDLVGSNLPIHL